MLSLLTDMGMIRIREIVLFVVRTASHASSTEAYRMARPQLFSCETFLGETNDVPTACHLHIAIHQHRPGFLSALIGLAVVDLMGSSYVKTLSPRKLARLQIPSICS